MIETLRTARWDHWQQALLEVMFDVVGSTIPVWVGVLFLWFLSQPLSAGRFLEHGEFALYSAALVAPSVFVIIKPAKNRKIEYFPWRVSLLLMFLVMLFVTAMLYAAVVVTSAPPDQQTFDLNVGSIRNASIILYLTAVILALAVAVADRSLGDFDFQDKRGKSREELGDQFDQLQEGRE